MSFRKNLNKMKTQTLQKQHYNQKRDISVNSNKSIFPPYTLRVLMVLTLANRLCLSISPTSWWILHPDEVFQSIEVAHSEVYNYGFRPYEYLPSKIPDSVSEKQHMKLSMHSMRSWLHPRFYIILFYFKECFSIKTNPFVFAKMCHAFLAGFLPLSIYKFLTSIQFPDDIAIISSILVAFSEQLVQIGTHTLIHSLCSPLLFYFLSDFFRITDMQKDNEETKQKISFHLFFISFCFGLLIYLRPDYILIISLLILTFRGKIILQNIQLIIAIIMGVSAGIFTGGFDDYFSYGLWFVSPWQWIRFQMYFAGNLFGRMNMSFYIKETIFSNYPNTILASMTLLIFGSFLFVNYSKVYREYMIKMTKLGLVVILLLVFYSFQPHKELRFIHDVIVLFLCISSVTVYVLYCFIRHLASENALYTDFLLFAEIILYVIDAFMFRNTIVHTESSMVNMSLDFVSKQSDVTGLLLDYSIYKTGGYTILHKDVPIFAKTHYEFREWSIDSRQNFSSKNYFGVEKNISLCLMDKVTNFVSVENSPLVLKSILSSPIYNYVIITEARKFLKKGFRDVFTIGNVTVYKREKTKYAKEFLKNFADKISIGSNSTLLQYEASWLMTLDLPNLAIDRLQRALQIDPQCVRCWQLLYVILDKTNPEKAKEIPNRCYSLINKEICDTPTEKIILHPEYQLKFPT
ncbi:uncharacterized protein [Centruroides vittatus]|uniref:uncharacterized protein isoform X1 n=2 Tax=Centruroides vittatus TaxID=120091 RepID=UPI003510D0B5